MTAKRRRTLRARALTIVRRKLRGYWHHSAEELEDEISLVLAGYRAGKREGQAEARGEGK